MQFSVTCMYYSFCLEYFQSLLPLFNLLLTILELITSYSFLCLTINTTFSALFNLFFQTIFPWYQEPMYSLYELRWTVLLSEFSSTMSSEGWGGICTNIISSSREGVKVPLYPWNKMEAEEPVRFVNYIPVHTHTEYYNSCYTYMPCKLHSSRISHTPSHSFQCNNWEPWLETLKAINNLEVQQVIIWSY